MEPLVLYPRTNIFPNYMAFSFTITKRDRSSMARTGVIETPHGAIHTPAFVPVATKAALRGVSLAGAQAAGAEILMMNTFHLFFQGQHRIISELGGLHTYAHTDLPLMTDSGGFQVFSLGFGREYGLGKLSEANNPGNAPHYAVHPDPRHKNLVTITEDGVTFTLPENGNRLELTPESSMTVQRDLGADIIFAFDECTPPTALADYTAAAVERTHRWAKRSIAAASSHQALMGVVQGGDYVHLREHAARTIGAMDFFGFGIGGSFGNSFGDSKTSMYAIVEKVNAVLPEGKPRHLLGIGEVDDLIEAVQRGVDTFDCVIPTRWARHGTAITAAGRVNIRAAKYLRDTAPLDAACVCAVCQTYSRAYLSHLSREKEIFGVMLLAEHNIHFILNLMERIRHATSTGTLSALKSEFAAYYK